MFCSVCLLGWDGAWWRRVSEEKEEESWEWSG